MPLTSLEAALKVLALSDVRITGKPRQPQNLRIASKKEETFKSLTNSKCMAQVAAQVNKQIYCMSCYSHLNFYLCTHRVVCTYSGPAKLNLSQHVQMGIL